MLNNELDENVKKVSITGLGDDETVVMKEELSEEELDQATGGNSINIPSGQWSMVGCLDSDKHGGCHHESRF